MTLPYNLMLRDAAMLEAGIGSRQLAADVACHVKALVAEAERLTAELESPVTVGGPGDLLTKAELRRLPDYHQMALDEIGRLKAENEDLRRQAGLPVDEPRFLFAGREPTENERCLLSLLSWRESENRALGEEIRLLRGGNQP